MDDVRIQLGKVFKAFSAVPGNFKAISRHRSVARGLEMNNQQLRALIAALEDIRKGIVKAQGLALARVENVVFAIGKEGARTGEILGFTHGPVLDVEELMDAPGVEDGDVLVRMVTKGTEQQQVVEAVWDDGKWVKDDEEPTAEQVV
jgi:hypothetical protein